MGEDRLGAIVACRLHLEDAADRAVLRLDLQRQPGPCPPDDQRLGVNLLLGVARQRESPMVGNLRGKDGGGDAAGEVERIRGGGERPVTNPERRRVNAKLYISAADDEAVPNAARGNRGPLTPGESQQRETTALTPGRTVCEGSI